MIHLFTYKTLKLLIELVYQREQFDSLIHLQDSQTAKLLNSFVEKFDSLIHLQDSQTPKL